MKLRLISILLFAAVPSLRAQTIATPRRGWVAALRFGLAYGRVVCDSPCRFRAGPTGFHTGVFLGHTVGDRAALGLGSTASSSLSSRNAPVRWGTGGFGIVATARPSPDSDIETRAMLGIGESDIGPRSLRLRPQSVLWALGIALDDPSRRGAGGYGELLGTTGARAPKWAEHPGVPIHAFSVAGGVNYAIR
ncbi:MAG TPA: hypothetical protein VIP11_00085 [Gemmatimonadaceae bacterium]